MRTTPCRALLVALVFCIAALAFTQAASAAFPNGDVFVSVSNGLVDVFTPSGTLVATLDTTKGGATTGMAFDSAGNLYVTDFSANAVSKFDPNGALLGDFGSGYNSHPESILFDSLTNAYVGQADGSKQILEFNAFGAPITSFSPTTESRGTDWIDLAADECTMHYTSEGHLVKTFNVCTNTQGSDFASGLPGSVAFAHRILPDGGELVADTGEIVRLDSSGAVVQTYDASGENTWFALNLDPDGTSFWSANFGTSNVYHFDIASGAILGSFSTGTASNTVFGLAVKGELTAATYKLDLEPKTASNPTGTTHTVTATLTKNGVPQSGQTIHFTVTGANNTSGNATTDASGVATFSYVGANVGTDTITATFDANNDGVLEAADAATKTWTDPLITATGQDVSATEGASFTGTVATFTDPDPNSTASEYAATIDWGDSSSSAGTISGPTGGPFTVSGTHTYAEEGSYPITVTISDVDNPSNNATTHSTATVADAALTAGTLTLSTGVEGTTPVNASFSFTDANTGAPASDFTATCSWGDSSSSAGTVTGSGGNYTVTCSHIYDEEGSYTVTVTVVDDGGSSTSGTGTAKVDDAALASVCAAPAVSPQSFSGNTATFTDADPNGIVTDYTATIAWGDSSTSPGTISGGPGNGPYTVSGTHTYTSTGFFTVTTTITDHPSTTAATCKVLVFAFAPGSGSFVIGDLNSAVGTSVTFWGAQWWQLNSLSGGPAPASFKGFALNPKTPSCGTDWSTDPGNSAPPPAGPLPAFMGVIVSSSITKSGSQISGNTPHIVVVQTNPGYDANPGHAGTGKVVAQFC